MGKDEPKTMEKPPNSKLPDILMATPQSLGHPPKPMMRIEYFPLFPQNLRFFF